MVSVGELAPQFSLQDSLNIPYSLSTLSGKKVVLYFYPKDDTPGCTIEAKEFSDLASDFSNINTIVFGISKDSIESHCKFRDKFGLSVTLLSDPEGQVTQAYGAWGEKSNYGKTYMGVIRSTVVIDESGKILKIWRQVKAAGHAEKVLTYIRTLS